MKRGLVLGVAWSLALSIMACPGEETTYTGVMLSIRYDRGLGLDQLRITVLRDQDVVVDQTLPETPGALSDDGETVAILLPEELAGESLVFRVDGLREGAVLVSGQEELLLVRDQVSDLVIQLDEHTLCGNGQLDADEACDGTNLNGEDCLSQGFTGGNLTCGLSCELDTSDCADCGNGVVESVEQCDDGNSEDWDGCNECSIAELRVNTSTAASQERACVASDGGGGFVVAWQGDDAGGDAGIFAQRFGDDGLFAGPELLVNTVTTGAQVQSDVAMAADGRFVVVWHGPDADSDGVYGRWYDAQGQPLASEQPLNTVTSGLQRTAAVAMAADGRAVVVWRSANLDGGGAGIAMRRYDAQGTPTGPEVVVNTTVAGSQNSPHVAMAEDGRFVVVWLSDDIDGMGVYAQRFSTTGQPLGGEIPVNTTTAGEQDVPRVAMAVDGESFVVTWESPDSDVMGVFAQAFDGAGVPLGSERQVNEVESERQARPSVAMLPGDTFVVTFESIGPDGDYYGVMTRRFPLVGEGLGPEVVVNLYTADRQRSSHVAAQTDGRMAVVWESQDQDGSDYGIYAQRFSSNGARLGSLSW